MCCCYQIFCLALNAGSEFGGLRLDLLDVSDHVEGDLRDGVQLTVQDVSEAGDGVLEGDISAWRTSKRLGDGEWLREESLDLSCTLDGQLLFGAQLTHTENGNNILKGFVILEDLLDIAGNVVVDGSDNVGVHDTAGGLQWVDSWVEAQLGDLSGKYGGGVQMGEGGGWGGIGQVIGWHVDGLYRGNGTLESGGNSFLHSTHIGGQGWLVTDGRWDTTEQSGHFGTGLRESENVVDKEKHILAFGVTEVLGDRQTGEGDSGTGSWRLVHLAVHEGDLGFIVLEGDDTTLNHLVVQIITLTSSLTDTGEDGVTTMGLGDVVNKLHNKYGLADTGTTEETNLTTLYVWGQEIDDLDTGFQNLDGTAGLDEFWWWGVDALEGLGLDWAPLVDWLADDVDDSAEGGGADWHHNWVASVQNCLAANDSLGGIHSDGSDGVLAQMLGDFEDQSVLTALHLEGVQNWWSVIVELDVDDWTNDGRDAAGKAGGITNTVSDNLIEHASVSST